MSEDQVKPTGIVVKHRDGSPLVIGGVVVHKRPQDVAIGLRNPWQLDDDDWPLDNTAPPDEPYRHRHGNPLLT